MNTRPVSIRGARLLVGAAVLIALAGCASTGGGKFSCPAPDGVTCLSPQEIYDATNDLPHLEGSGATSGKGAALPARAAGSAAAYAHAPADASQVTRQGGALALADGGASRSRGAPLLQPAQVLRIWISPWTDAAGDLHMPGYVYTEIRERTWAVGSGTPTQEQAQLFDPNALWRDSATGAR